MRSTFELGELAKEAERVARDIAPLLAGRDPGVQGAILADLLTTWLLGHHPPAIREMMLEVHVDAVRALVQLNERTVQ